MPYRAYILQSTATGRFYIGHAEILTKRIYEHNNNRTVSIKNRGPWELYYSEEYFTRMEAAQRERQIKAMKSRAYIQKLARVSR